MCRCNLIHLHWCQIFSLHVAITHCKNDMWHNLRKICSSCCIREQTTVTWWPHALGASQTLSVTFVSLLVDQLTNTGNISPSDLVGSHDLVSKQLANNLSSPSSTFGVANIIYHNHTFDILVNVWQRYMLLVQDHVLVLSRLPLIPTISNLACVLWNAPIGL